MEAQILRAENVRKLAEKFDLDLPKLILEVDRYELDGKQIVIKSVKVFDQDGKFVKFADNEKLIDMISEYPIKFKKL
jgi:hypothetical protein